eukprot:6211715-Pleurochrysis_carterae.AAC.1
MRSHLKPSLCAADSKGSTPKPRRREEAGAGAGAGTLERKTCSIGFRDVPEDKKEDPKNSKLVKARRPSVPMQVMDFLAKNQARLACFLQTDTYHTACLLLETEPRHI